MNKQVIFLTEKFHFFAKNGGRQKRGEDGGGFSVQQIVVIALVLLVIGMVALFFFNNDINQYFRNLLPTYQENNQTSDEVINGADEQIKNICPIMVAQMFSKDDKTYLKVNISGVFPLQFGIEFVLTSIYVTPVDSNGIFLIKVGGNTVGKIQVDKTVLIEDKYLSESLYNSASSGTTAGSSIPGEISSEISQAGYLKIINGSMSKGGGIFCKNK